MKKFIFALITIFFIFLLFRLVNLKEALKLIVSANKTFIVLATIIGVFQSFISALRMKTLLNIISKVNIFYLFWMGYLSALISIVFPFYVGGFSLAYFVSKKIKSTYLKTFSVVFVDFSLGLLPILVLTLISILFFGSKKVISTSFMGKEHTPLITLFIIVVSISVFFFIIKKLFLKNILKKLNRGIILFTKTKPVLLKAAIITLPLVIMHFLQFYLYFLAFGMKPNWPDFVLAVSLLSTLNLIPGAFAKIGQYETFAVLTLPYLLSEDPTRVFSVVLLQHSISLVTIGTLGVISAFYLRSEFINLRGLKSNLLSKLTSVLRGRSGGEVE